MPTAMFAGETAEQTLLNCCAAGDRGAFDVLWDRYRDRVYHFICYRVEDFDEAEDLKIRVGLPDLEQHQMPRGHHAERGLDRLLDGSFQMIQPGFGDDDGRRFGGSGNERGATQKLSEAAALDAL